MSRFVIEDTDLAGLKVLRRQPMGDARGFLERLFCDADLGSLLEGRTIRQINHTLTEKTGTVRGMHFQYSPRGETKIVACLRGTVFDVAVDLRPSSPSYLQWFGTELSAENFTSLYIPEGFAHGFQTFTENCELIYLHTQNYSPGEEGAVNATDPKLAITWPLPIVERSQRDEDHALIDDDFRGIIL